MSEKMKQSNEKTPDDLQQAICSVEISRIISGDSIEKTIDRVVAEQALTIMIDKVGSFTIMATPCDIEALAIGFVYCEGMIDGIEDIVDISIKPQLPNVVGIQLHDPTQISVRRNMIVASSCGMCGTRNIDKMLSEIPACKMSLETESSVLVEVIERLTSMQRIFRMTGGSHAAAIFDSSGRIVSFAEDLGRHSALDKAIGKCLLNKLSMKGCGVVLSGRVSLEMVTKAARANLELIAAVSAPSSFAIEVASRWNITLCGFVRSGRMNVYTHHERLSDRNGVQLDNTKDRCNG